MLCGFFFLSSRVKLSHTEDTQHHFLHYILEYLTWEFAAWICRGYLPREFASGICRRNFPQEFSVGIYRRKLPWLFAMGFLYVSYSSSDNLTLPISRVLTGRYLIFSSLTSRTCCNSPRKCTPVKYRDRQKAGFPIVTYITSCKQSFFAYVIKSCVCENKSF